MGDSVLVGAASDTEHRLQSRGATVGIEASVGLQAQDAIGTLQELRKEGQLGEVVVIHIGNNGPITASQFDRIMRLLDDTEEVIIVNDKVPRPWEEPNNEVLREGVERHPKAELVDWREASENRPELSWDDGIHLKPAGQREYANLIASRVEDGPLAGTPATDRGS